MELTPAQLVPFVQAHDGRLAADCYEDAFASDPRIDRLRLKMRVREEPRFTEEYYDLDKRAIGNSVQVFFKDNTCTEKVIVDYPMGHHRRRTESIPLLEQEFRSALAACFPLEQAQAINELFLNREKLEATPVNEFVDLLVTPGSSG